MTVKEHLTALGGIVAVAKALDLPVSTVSGWSISNRVPKWREPALRELSEAAGLSFPDKFAERAA
jgi:hypothetical protein